MLCLRVIIAEIKRDIKESFNYKMGIFSDLVVFSFLILSLLFFGSGSSLQDYYGGATGSKSLLLIGYLFWVFSIYAINSTSTEIHHEALKGTLEQKFMAVVPIGFLFLGKMLSGLFISTIIIGLITALVLILTGVSLKITSLSIILLVINLIGMYGIGLIFGSIALRIKKIGQLTFILQFLLLFLTDTITKTPLSEGLGKVIPLTNGINLVRQSISGLLVAKSEMIYFIIISLIWILLGIVIFSATEKKVRQDGTLNFY
ncbi:MAG TPA: ABC transporter permease [Firmicutes bacterium]|nr:ABC transporter permease [Bacillota bacterium]